MWNGRRANSRPIKAVHHPNILAMRVMRKMGWLNLSTGETSKGQYVRSILSVGARVLAYIDLRSSPLDMIVCRGWRSA